MNNKIPHTPFSTQLSGSAKEVEIRIRNLYSGPKKRPPVPLMVLTVLMILFCGNLVSCRQRPAQPVIVMETQYYDRYANYVEIPVLALPAGEQNDAVDAINAALNDLREQYASTQNSITGSNHCLFYPSTTERYLNLLFFEDYYKTDLNTGHVFSQVYDLKEGTLVSAGDALALAGLNEKGLLDQVTEQVQAQLERDQQEYGYDFPLALHNLTLEGFRIKANGQPVFYLTGRVDDADDDVLDAISGADHLFIWEDRTVTTYNQYSVEPVPLVPAEETDRLDPPLWNQWYFAGEEPAGGFASAPVSSQSAADLRAVLLGDMLFTDAEVGLVLDISRVTETVTPSQDFTAYPARFAYLDLDGDWTNEAVLWLETEEGDPALAFLVLRWQGEGRVYGYLRFPRTFGDLRQDGTFEFSSSGVDFGIGRVMFQSAGEGMPDEWVTWDTALQERIDGDWDNLAWYLDGSPVSLDQFQEALDQQNAKEPAVWREFTPEMIEQVIS